MVNKILDKVISICCADGTPFGKHEEETQEAAPVKKTEEPVQKKSRAAFKPKKSSGGKFTGVMTKYNDYKYSNLPLKVKKAVKTLGHTEADWPTGWPASEGKWFEDLTSEEQAAAKTLGYDATSWNTFYEDKSWEELPKDVKMAAEVAGFTEETWDGDQWPESTDKSWEDLDEDVQKAMMVLGYCKNEW